MIIHGRAVVIPGDNVDTDVMYPGPYLNIEEPEQMKPYLFESYDPALRDQLGGDTIVVTGWNFGLGSSREHVPQAMKAWGVRCVLGRSFARIFRRNCINLGMPVVECPEAAAAAKSGSNVAIDTRTGEVTVDSSSFRARPPDRFVLELQDCGGLVAWAAKRLPGSVTGGDSPT